MAVILVPPPPIRSQKAWRYNVPAPALDTEEFTALPSGVPGLLIFKPDFTAPTGLAGPIIPISWSTSRYSNQAGQWSATIPIDGQLIDGAPLQTQVRRGWHICIIQENNHPEHDTTKEFLLYMGIVLDREYIIAGTTAALRLSGAFRTQHLLDRFSIGSLDFEDVTVANIVSTLVNGSNIIGSPGGVIAPVNPSRKLTVHYKNQSRLEALYHAAKLGRYTVRESWDHDRLELVAIDGPPPSGITFIKVESSDPDLDSAGEAGFGIIAGTPQIRYDGSAIITRVIPIGADTPAGDLTLEHSDQTSPYTIQNGTDESGNTYYYLQDTEAETEYGIVELRLVRTDVKNPSDDTTTRRLSANVLYATAVDQLIKNRSEKVFLQFQIANGANIWALPGDMIRVDYTGWIENENGQIVWAEIPNQRFVVMGRHDLSSASGVRMVEFAVGAPALEFEIPGLPDAIVLPPLSGGGGSISIPDFEIPDFNIPPFELPAFPGFEMPPGTEFPFPGYQDPNTEVNNGGHLPGSTDHTDNTYGNTTDGFNLPLGVLRTNDDVLEYWDGSNWLNFGDSLSTSDPGGGRVWLSDE